MNSKQQKDKKAQIPCILNKQACVQENSLNNQLREKSPIPINVSQLTPQIFHPKPVHSKLRSGQKMQTGSLERSMEPIAQKLKRKVLERMIQKNKSKKACGANDPRAKKVNFWSQRLKSKTQKK